MQLRVRVRYDCIPRDRPILTCRLLLRREWRVSPALHCRKDSSRATNGMPLRDRLLRSRAEAGFRSSFPWEEGGWKPHHEILAERLVLLLGDCDPDCHVGGNSPHVSRFRCVMGKNQEGAKGSDRHPGAVRLGETSEPPKGGFSLHGAGFSSKRNGQQSKLDRCSLQRHESLKASSKTSHCILFETLRRSDRVRTLHFLHGICWGLGQCAHIGGRRS